VKNTNCIQFLQWVLPHLHMRWPGFRNVRGQVCKRITQRLSQLKLQDVVAYQHYLTLQPHEWPTLDCLSRVTIARFYRDKRVFSKLSQEVLPALAVEAQTTGENTLHCWSIGCGSGIVATDIDPHLLKRCHKACYPPSSIKNLPDNMHNTTFTPVVDHYCLQHEYKTGVDFLKQDIRTTMPPGPFHLVLCRNLVFTYFDEELQRKILCEIQARLCPHGWLLLGVREKLHADSDGFTAISERLGLYQKLDDTQS